MLAELIIALVLGCLTGVITGLLPGLHTNTIAVMVVGSLPIFMKYFPILPLGVFLVSMVITNSFTGFIPTIFIGAPEAETALGILPGHKLLLEGKGYHALKLTIIGGVGAFVIGLLMTPLLFLLLKKGYEFLVVFIVPLILGFSSLFILTEKGLKQKVWAMITFLLSGVLGVVVLNGVNVPNPLFPLLSGLFGISTLLLSLKNSEKIAEQIITPSIKFLSFRNIVCFIKASLSSALMSVLPALGAAQATIVAQGFVKKGSGEDYLIIVGGINSVSSLFVLTTAYLIERARTGVIAALMEFTRIDWHSYAVFMAASVAAVGFSVIITLYLGKFLANRIWKINYALLSWAIIAFIIVLTIIFCNWLGLFVLSISTALGMLAPKVGCRRIHAMGVLVLPVVLFFI